MKELLKEVLAQIKPDEKLKKETMKKVKEFLKKLNKELKSSATAKLGGSFAKNTWLKGDHDVDVFAVFKKQANSEALEKALKKWKAERIRGSRDYFQIKNGVTFEIVPVQEKQDNITDYSLGHVKWVNKKNNKDDILLTKKFCKAAGVYGAESYIRGFSGHVIDILTIHYKGFENLIKQAAKWKEKTIVDTNNAHKGKTLQTMNTSKTTGPLIVVDPLQKERNAAAALNKENYDKFVQKTKEFLKKPDKKYFEEQKPNYEELKKQGELIITHATPKKGKKDIELTRIAKVFEKIKQETQEYKIKKSGIQWGQTPTMWAVYRKKTLPKTYEQKGPPTTMKEHAQAFKKGRKTFTKQGRIYAIIKRKHTTPLEAEQQTIKQDYIKQKVNTIKCGKQ